MEKYSTRDALADARRTSPAWYFLPSALGALIWGIAVFWALDRPDLSDSARTFWVILPFPFFAIGLISWFARERRLDEVQRAIEHRAAYITWNFTAYYAMGVILLQTAGFSFDWREIVIWPVLVHLIVFLKTHKRLVGK